MPRAICKGSGQPGKILQVESNALNTASYRKQGMMMRWRKQYIGECPVCKETFRLNAKGEVFHHRTPQVKNVMTPVNKGSSVLTNRTE
jgi:hypothetical protein